MRGGIRRVFVYVLALFFLSCGLFAPGPAAVAKEFLFEVEKGDLTKAVDRLTGPTVAMFGKEKVRMGLAQGMEDLKRKGGIKSIDVKKEEIAGETAGVALLVTYKNGSTSTENMKLMKVDKQWKILMELR